jgi:hypothetical protein
VQGKNLLRRHRAANQIPAKRIERIDDPEVQKRNLPLARAFFCPSALSGLIRGRPQPKTHFANRTLCVA